MVQAWSISGRYPTRNKALSPGPGQYSSRNNSINKLSSPRWTIGTSKRGELMKNRALSPGPGMYTNKIWNTAPKYHFGTKSITDLDKFKKSVPGPGQYNPASNGFNKTAFSFAGRHNLSNKDLLNRPGPGAYSNRSTLSKAMGKFGTSKKWTPLASKLVIDNPGPGQYPATAVDTNKSSAPKYGFGSEKRGNDFHDKMKKSIPGPGEYGHSGKIGSGAPKYTLTPRRPDTTPAVGRHSPGPGNYNPSDNFSKTKSPNCKFGNSQRRDTRRDTSPGPDSYSLSGLDSRKKSSPSFGFGSSKRPALSKAGFTPGPGNYRVTNKNCWKNWYYMGLKLKNREKDNIPGPGNYNPDDNIRKNRSPNYKIGSSPRGGSNKFQELVPGPGTYKYYNPSLDKGPHVRIGTEMRGKQLASDTPGPGAYKIPVKIIDVPRYLISNPEEKYKFV